MILPEVAVSEHWKNKTPGAFARIPDRFMLGIRKLQQSMLDSIHRHIGHAGGCGSGSSLPNVKVTQVERVENTRLFQDDERSKQSLREVAANTGGGGADSAGGREVSPCCEQAHH